MRRTPANIGSSQDKSGAVKGTIIGEREAGVNYTNPAFAAEMRRVNGR